MGSEMCIRDRPKREDEDSEEDSDYEMTPAKSKAPKASKLTSAEAAKATATATATSTATDSFAHMSYSFLQPDKMKDGKGRLLATDPEADPETLYVPQPFLAQQTPAQRYLQLA